jgi:hypothetical protein
MANDNMYVDRVRLPDDCYLIDLLLQVSNIARAEGRGRRDCDEGFQLDLWVCSSKLCLGKWLRLLTMGVIGTMVGLV